MWGNEPSGGQGRTDRIGQGERLRAHDKKGDLLFSGYTLFDRWDAFLIAMAHTFSSETYYTAVQHMG